MRQNFNVTVNSRGTWFLLSNWWKGWRSRYNTSGSVTPPSHATGDELQPQLQARVWLGVCVQSHVNATTVMCKLGCFTVFIRYETHALLERTTTKHDARTTINQKRGMT